MTASRSKNKRVSEDRVHVYGFHDDSSQTMEFAAEVVNLGCDSTIRILLDGEDGEEIGTCKVGRNSGMVKAVVKAGICLILRILCL